MAENQDEQEQQISKYSSGVSIMMRINALWIDANNHSRAGMFSKWNTDLDTIWRELARDITEKDYKPKKEEFDGFDTQLITTGPFKDSGGETFDGLTSDQTTARSKQYKILNDKELFLKRLENSLGKGTTWDEGDGDDWE